MPNQEGRESNNDAAEAMRTIQGLRGVNTSLRAAGPEPPPMTPEEAAEQFARETGIRIDPYTGQQIGLVEGWVRPAGKEAPRIQSLDELREERALVEGQEMARESGPPNPSPREFVERSGLPVPVAEPMPVLMNGVDLDQGVVVVDGTSYPMTDDEKKGVVLFTSEAMVRAVQRQSKDRLRAAGFELEEGPARAKVSKVSRGKAGGAVPARSKSNKR